MLVDLLSYYSLRPWKLSEFKILYHFRKERETRGFEAYTSLEQAQYAWCAEKSGASLSNIQKVIDKWIFTHPNQYLLSCVFPGTHDFFAALQQNGVKIAIYSDYKAEEKLKAMRLPADLVVSSTDPEINKLKPYPDGLLYIAQKLGVPVSECLFIGDRDEKDGQCARNANMPYLILEKQPYKDFKFYETLIKYTQTLNNQTFYDPSFAPTQS
jgi:phosphoglycolate phosphatase/putative hydrolase of the HAD superfamily